MEGKCTGLTQKGLPCKRYAIYNGKCKLHGGNERVYLFDKQCITLTFSNVVENSVGMEKIGEITDYKPFSVTDLENIYKSSYLEKYDKELILLSLNIDNIIVEPASVLVIRNFYNNSDKLFNILTKLEWDTKALMKGEVKNKLARHNLCFADFEQEPDYINGKGSVIDINSINEFVEVQSKISDLTGYKNLKAEGNLYFDCEHCGIGWHGDFERNIVIGLRLGDSIPLCFNWFHECKPIGDKFTINLNHGDLYIMSEKAVGHDWKKRSQYTLRHSAGCAKYTSL
jgi:hypothetical protein